MISHLIVKFSHRFLRGEDGATAVEYGLLVALIAAVIIISVIALGVTVNGIFTDYNSAFTSAVDG